MLHFNKSSAVAKMGDSLATIDMGLFGGGLCPFFGGVIWVPIWHTVAWAEADLRIKWHLEPSSHLATIDMGRKLEGEVWGGCAPLGRGAGSPCNTIWPGSRLPPFQLAS